MPTISKTALSHLYNLYFVAYCERIFVYQPQFPTQNLASQPDLIIDTPASSLDLPGHIEPRKPRAINNLVVQVLGHSEVLAVGKSSALIHTQSNLVRLF